MFEAARVWLLASVGRLRYLHVSTVVLSRWQDILITPHSPPFTSNFGKLFIILFADNPSSLLSSSLALLPSRLLSPLFSHKHSSCH